MNRSKIIIFEGLNIGWVVDTKTLDEIGIHNLKRSSLLDVSFEKKNVEKRKEWH